MLGMQTLLKRMRLDALLVTLKLQKNGHADFALFSITQEQTFVRFARKLLTSIWMIV